MDEYMDEEDVVLKGSVIDQYLQSIGFDDYDVTQTTPCHLSNKSALKEGRLKVKWAQLKKKLFDIMILLVWPKELRKSFYKRIPRQVFKSRLQNSDDVAILKHFVPHLFTFPDNQRGQSITFQIFLWCIRVLLVITAVVFSLQLFIEDYTIWSSCILIPAFTAIVWIVTASWMMYKSVAEVENFLEILEESGQLIQKSMRLLLEEDLVSRGFVLAQGSSAFHSSDGREVSHCKGLRQALHRTLDATLPVLRSVHEHLQMLVNCYPCITGLFDEVEEVDAQLLQNSTEHLKFLKKLVTLVKLQMSSVVTGLVLCTTHDVEEFEQVLDKQNLFSSHLVHEVSRSAQFLAMYVRYAQSFWQRDIENRVTKKNGKEKQKNVFIAIHSLILHMQAALLRVHDLEKKFANDESISSSTEAIERSSVEVLPSYEFVKEQLNSIQIELQSCQSCLDETSVRVDRKYAVKEEDKPQSDSETAVNISEVVTAVVSLKKSPIPIFELEEPVHKDEVFEAYIDQEYCDNREREMNDDFWNTDAKRERQKLRQQKEQGKRVLHELQPVLNKLRKVWEDRETVALHRQKADIPQALNSDDLERRNKKEGDTGIPALVPTTERLDFEDRDTGSDGEKLEVFTKVNKDFNVSKNNENLQQETFDRLEDSDEERLEVYRKVKKELEMDEKSYTPDSVEDSDDERLEVYKKMRMELDKDEQQEKMDSMSVGHVTGEQSKLKFRLPCTITTTGFMPLHSVSESEVTSDSSNLLETKDKVNSSFQSLLNSSKSSMEINDANSALSATQSDQVLENVVSIHNSKYDKIEPSSKDMEEEIFAHGEDIDDDSPHIDWSTVTLPVRMTETLEDRMQLFCGGQNRGFHAELAAEAQAASHQLLTKRGKTVEIFGGVGEGEEIFGDDEDSD